MQTLPHTGFVHTQAAEADEVDAEAVLLRLEQPLEGLKYLRLQVDGRPPLTLASVAGALGFGVPVVACGTLLQDGGDLLPVLQIGAAWPGFLPGRVGYRIRAWGVRAIVRADGLQACPSLRTLPQTLSYNGTLIL